MLLQPDGSIVMAGGSEIGTGADYAFALVRYLPDAPVETGPDPAHAFVVHAYEDLLGREPEAFGLGAWTALLSQGMSQTEVARAILSSVEYRMREVEGLYHHLLHRDADSAGLHAFVQYLVTNPLEQAQALMLGSNEYFQSRAGSDDDHFLAVLYEDTLGRPIDPAGHATATQALARGATRAQVAGTVLRSEEYVKNLIGNFYLSFLHKSADATGMSAFLTAVGHGAADEDVIAQVLGSPEYALWQ
jgi:hypothetical protein